MLSVVKILAFAFCIPTVLPPWKVLSAPSDDPMTSCYLLPNGSWACAPLHSLREEIDAEDSY